MVKQYRMNTIVEAVYYDGSPKAQEEVKEFLGSELTYSYTNFKWEYGWVIKNIFGQIVVIPDNIFKMLYSEVNE